MELNHSLKDPLIFTDFGVLVIVMLKSSVGNSTVFGCHDQSLQLS